MGTKFRSYAPRARSSNGVSKIVRDNYGPNWFSIKKKVEERDTYLGVLTCFICKKPIVKGESRETHHLRALTKGGTTTLTNLATVHSSCHDTRHPHLMKRRGGSIS